MRLTNKGIAFVIVFFVIVFCYTFHGHAACCKMGDIGKVVATVQYNLLLRGYDLDVDSEFGQKTKKCVMDYQKQVHLPVTGRVDEKTYMYLSSRPYSCPSSLRVLDYTFAEFGVPYVFGGETHYGWDCSALVQKVLAKVGKYVERTADRQYYTTSKISVRKIRPGDLVFFSTYLPGPSHVGIYVNAGRFIHASSSKGVSIARLDNPYWLQRFLGATRV